MYKVIIADDEYMIHASLAKQVESSGLPFQVVGEAEDGQEALQLLSKQPDLIITDICMPGMDGLTFIEQAKDINPHIVFLIISGYGDFEYARSALRLGVEDFLLKPVNPDKFKHTLTSILQKIESRKQQVIGQKQRVVGQMELEKEIADCVWRLNESGADQAVNQLINHYMHHYSKEISPLTFVRQLKLDLQAEFEGRGIALSGLERDQNDASEAQPSGLIADYPSASLTEMNDTDASKMEEEVRCYISLLADKVKEARNFGSRHHILEAIAYTKQHLGSSDLSVRQAADIAGMSVTYFSRLFKEETGLSYIQYLIKIRMEKARSLLEQQFCSATEACERIGYTDYPHFSKTFKRHYGIAPADYMKHHRSI
ncbi:response regulator [Neobacillus mesonae]|nr:response regulator [Neobacillus mesonae]